MEPRGHILVVEDDADISAMICRELARNDFASVSAATTAKTATLLKNYAIELIILDISLPNEDGLSFCVRLRRTSNIPIIFLTARAEMIDRVLGLNLGADDYITKPFDLPELMARIRAVLRRNKPDATKPIAYVFSDWRLDLIERLLYSPTGVAITLSSTEYELLIFLCQSPGRMISRERLLQVLKLTGSRRSIDVIVSRLRRKIDHDDARPQLIQTVRSGGYIFAAVVREEL